MGKKYIVKYDREGCIGAGACVGMDPNNWIIEPADAKANLIGGAEDSAGWWVKEIDETELEAMINAAKACPVTVIHVYEKDTGKQVI